MGGARSLAQLYRRFGEGDAAGTSPLYERVAIALSESEEALRAIGAAPARKRHPTVILAALHDLALSGRAPALAAAYAAADPDAAADAAIDTLLRMTDAVVAVAARRRTRTDETGHCAVLYPAVAEAARRVGADAVGLIDLGCSAGLNLNLDRVGITYGSGRSLGDPSSPVQLTASTVGDRPVPTRAIPAVVARVGVDRDPLDVTDADDARWLRARVRPDEPERLTRLEAEMALAATAPPLLLQGDPLEMLPDAFARAPADALPVVTTTWALSQLALEACRPGERRRRLNRRPPDRARLAFASRRTGRVGTPTARPPPAFLNGDLSLMEGPRVTTALAASLVLLAVSMLFAATSACGGALRATTRHRRALRHPAAAIRRRRRFDGLAGYVAACDRSRSDEPPWWPEFERQFRRECRRHGAPRRRS